VNSIFIRRDYDIDTQKKNCVKIQGKDNHLQAIYKPRSEVLRRNQFCWYLALGILASRTKE
jgi:hypothetical protein